LNGDNPTAFLSDQRKTNACGIKKPEQPFKGPVIRNGIVALHPQTPDRPDIVAKLLWFDFTRMLQATRQVIEADDVCSDRRVLHDEETK
jgi:hypothetical protein